MRLRSIAATSNAGDARRSAAASPIGNAKKRRRVHIERNFTCPRDVRFAPGARLHVTQLRYTLERSIWNKPRPCVAHTSVSPTQKSSSTEHVVGPSLVGDHVAPASSLANTPT